MTTCTESLHPDLLYRDAFGVDAPSVVLKPQAWPRGLGVFIRARPGPDDTVERELVAGQFGLVPTWVKSASDAKLRSTKLVNARSETLTTATPFRPSWLAGQRCIVPVQAFLEDDFRSGKAVPTRIARIDGKPMGMAGVWERWVGAGGEEIVSYAVITVNANSHALLHRYQQPGAEKRMPVILNEGSFDAWLQAPTDKAKEFLRPYAAEKLTANPVEKGRRDKS